MAQVTATAVNELRQITGAGMMDCKKALTETDGDMEKATRILREKGIATAEKRAGKSASEGIIESYVHGTAKKIGVLVELNCETDFVARNEAFRELARNIAMHIAASNPKYIERSEIAAEQVKEEEEIQRQRALNEGRPEQALAKIVGGRLDKWYGEVCLLEQPYIRNEPGQDNSIQDLLNEAIGKLGEKILVKRFVRLAVGEGE